MSSGDESTERLLNCSENLEIIQTNDSAYRRNQREPIKMTSALWCFAIFALVTFVYCVKYTINDKVSYSFEEKLGITRKYASNTTLWTYECKSSQCVRRSLNPHEVPKTLESCNMLCSLPSLWPQPNSIKLSNPSTSTFRKSLFILKFVGPSIVNKDVKQAFNILLDNLPYEPNSWLYMYNVDLTNVFVNVNVTKEGNRPKSDTDESYRLSVKKTSNYVVANVTAKNYFGARHGLETLSQLIWLDTISKKLKIYHGIEIQDRPAFAHRGLMVDTARNFFPIHQLLKVVDGMAANKLNVFHLHLTDAVSFPIVLPTNPWMAEYGAYSPDRIYKPEDIKGLVEYARIRGIRVLLEVDAPSHVNEGWNHANKYNDKLVICGDDDVTNGHLNPDSNRTFKLLEAVYADLLQLGTDQETFHVGGDEVNLSCYSHTNAASAYSDMYEFWADLNNKIYKTVTKAFKNNAPKNLVIWSNDLTDRYMSYLKFSNNLVVQYWFGQIEPILSNGNKIIFSTVGKWYLDCGFGPWKSSEPYGSCDPYTHWKIFYTYRPWDDYPQYKNQVLGGEACLWSEQVDVDSLETRIWPRTAALAERLWSDMSHFDTYDVFTRISSQRDRLIGRGIKAAAIWPEWCTQHPGRC